MELLSVAEVGLLRREWPRGDARPRVSLVAAGRALLRECNGVGPVLAGRAVFSGGRDDGCAP